MVDIEATIEVFANNPPSILIALGFLCAILGAFFQVANQFEVASILYVFGALGIVAGIGLQVLWLGRS